MELLPGDITVESGVTFDFENATEYNLTIEITDTSGEKAIAVLTVSITDVDEAPVIDNLPATVNISENSVSMETVFMINGSDPEGEMVTYAIVSTNPTGAPFTIVGM